MIFLHTLLFSVTLLVRQPSDTAQVNRLNEKASHLMTAVSDSTFIVAEKALNMASKLNYQRGRATAYATIGKMHYKLGNYDLSLKAAYASLNISNELNDVAGKANAYNVLGLNYLAQEKIETGLKEFKRAAAINLSMGNKARLAANYFNFGLSFLEMGRLDSASHYFKQCMLLSEQVPDANLIAMAANRIGDIHFKKGNTKSAISFYHRVIDNKAYQNDWENTFAYSGLAECYLKLRTYDLAIQQGLKGLALAQKIEAKWDIRRAASILHQAYAAKKDFANGYFYQGIDARYTDSLYNDDQDKEVNAMHLKSQVSENEILLKKNQLNEQQNKLNRLTLFFAGTLLVFLIAIVFVIYRNSRKVKRLNLQLQDLILTKDQLFSIIGHDLRSPMSTIVASLDLLKSGTFTEEETREIFGKFSQQVTATSFMLDNLLHWAGDQQKGVRTHFTEVTLPEITVMVLDVFQLMADDKEIAIVHDADPNAVIFADKDQVRIIIQNIVANAIKFTPWKGRIDIAYRRDSDHVSIIIKDSGLGIAASKLEALFVKSGTEISTYGTSNEKGVGLGLMLVKKFVDQNNGKLTVRSVEGEGTEFVIEFAALQ
ncbi:MAG: tetratricopeptide repeat protein [Bacteroidota bacterium]